MTSSTFATQRLIFNHAITRAVDHPPAAARVTDADTGGFSKGSCRPEHGLPAAGLPVQRISFDIGAVAGMRHRASPCFSFHMSNTPQP
jgi:hypothetical protein